MVLSFLLQAILVYDVGSKKTFDNLEIWVKECTKYGGGGAVVAVAGNKVCDIFNQQQENQVAKIFFRLTGKSEKLQRRMPRPGRHQRDTCVSVLNRRDIF